MHIIYIYIYIYIYAYENISVLFITTANGRPDVPIPLKNNNSWHSGKHRLAPRLLVMNDFLFSFGDFKKETIGNVIQLATVRHFCHPCSLNVIFFVCLIFRNNWHNNNIQSMFSEILNELKFRNNHFCKFKPFFSGLL